MTTWLFLTLALCAFAWLAVPTAASRHRAATVAALPVVALVAWVSLLQPLGKPAAPPSAGKYTVLGARIDVPTQNSAGAIYVLLDGAPKPTYYAMPYTKAAAEQLQGAMDGEGDVSAVIGPEGGVSFNGQPPVTDDENKTVEMPLMNIE